MNDQRVITGAGGGSGGSAGPPAPADIVTIYIASHTDPRRGRTAVVALLSARGVWKALGYETRTPLPTEAAEIEALLCALEGLTRPWLVHVVTADEEFALGLADLRHRCRDPLAEAGWDALEEALSDHTLFCCEISPGDLVLEGLRQAARHAVTVEDVEDDLPDIERYAPLLEALELSLHEGEELPEAEDDAEDRPADEPAAPAPAHLVITTPAAAHPHSAQQSLFTEA